MEQEYLYGKHSRRLKTGQSTTVESTLFLGRRELHWALSSPIATVTELDGGLIMRNCYNKNKRVLLMRSR